MGGIMAAMAHPGLSLIAVPKSVLAKWYREIHQTFPKAKVEVLGYKPIPGKSKFPTDKTPLAEKAGKVFFDPSVDIVLTTHQLITRFKISELEKAMADEQAAIAQHGEAESRSIEHRRERFIQRAAERDFVQKGTDFTWTNLPLASMLLIVDEAQHYRSLFPMPTTGWSDRLIMCGSSSPSKSARDLLIKTDLLRKAGGKTLALTATPVTNSVAECFSMLRIFGPDVLNARNLTNTQQFIDHYCHMEPKTAVSPTGKIMEGRAITEFSNLDDLRSMWQTVMKTRTAVSEGLIIPQPNEQIINVEQTPAMTAFINEQRKLLSQAIKDEKPSHIFKTMANIHKLATFPPMLGITDNPKAEEVVKRILQNKDRGSQIVFIDLIEAQEGLRDLLKQNGIDRVALINGKHTPTAEKRIQIQDRYNQGELQVVIGGAAASVGMDLQINTSCIHHLSLPWEGQTVHQRNGRGIRQGNQQNTVKVFYYLLDGSTDTYRHATITTKTTWLESLRSAQTDDIRDNIFSDPVPDKMIAAMAEDPEEAYGLLMQQRKQRDEAAQSRRFMALLHTTRNYLKQKPGHLIILQNLEKKLRRLDLFPKETIDEAICRIQVARAAQKLNPKRAATYYLGAYLEWKDQFLHTDQYTLQFTRDQLVLPRLQHLFDDTTGTFIEPSAEPVKPAVAVIIPPKIPEPKKQQKPEEQQIILFPKPKPKPVKKIAAPKPPEKGICWSKAIQLSLF